MHYRLLGFRNFDYNAFELFIKHGLGNFTKHGSEKVKKGLEKVPIPKKTWMNKMLNLCTMN